MRIRAAEERDLPALAAIYDHEVATGVATFDTEPRPLSAWAERRASTAPGDHVLLVEDDHTVLGYATAGPYRPKLGYRLTRETTIYLTPGAQGRGVGRALYDDLLALLVADGMHLAVAGIAEPNPASEALHLACGFARVGTMREVGRKHDRWIDVTWWQKLLA